MRRASSVSQVGAGEAPKAVGPGWTLELGTFCLWLVFLAGGVAGLCFEPENTRHAEKFSFHPIQSPVDVVIQPELPTHEVSEVVQVAEEVVALPQPGPVEPLLVASIPTVPAPAQEAPRETTASPASDPREFGVRAVALPTAEGSTRASVAVSTNASGSSEGNGSSEIRVSTLLKFGEGEGRQPAPIYPRLARRQRQQGRILVEMRVNAGGRVERVEIVRPCKWPLLNDAAVDVVREQWRFQPGTERQFQVEIRFELTQ